MHSLLADIFREVALGEQEKKPEENAAQIGQRHEVQAVQVSCRDVPVDSDLGKVGAQELGSRVKRQEQEGNGHELPVGLQVQENPLHETGVVSLAQNLVVPLKGIGHRCSPLRSIPSTSLTNCCLR